MQTSALDGIYAPVLTPFRQDLSPDVELFSRYCHWLVGQGAGLAVFGTNSEANSLSLDEKLRLLDSLIEAGIPSGRLLPGTGSCAIPEAGKLTAHAVGHGVAGVLMLPPFYYKGVSDEGLYRFYAETIERVGNEKLKICLYHIPQISGVPITLGLIEMLLRDFPGTIAGIKDSSGDWANTESVLNNFPDLRVFPGSDVFLLQGLRAGGAGCISATANINPAAIRVVFDNWQADGIDAKQAGLSKVRAAIEAVPMIPALKRVIAHYSGVAGFATVRPPLVSLADESAQAVIADLDRLGFLPDGLKNSLQGTS